MKAGVVEIYSLPTAELLNFSL